MYALSVSIFLCVCLYFLFHFGQANFRFWRHQFDIDFMFAAPIYPIYSIYWSAILTLLYTISFCFCLWKWNFKPFPIVQMHAAVGTLIFTFTNIGNVICVSVYQSGSIFKHGIEKNSKENFQIFEVFSMKRFPIFRQRFSNTIKIWVCKNCSTLDLKIDPPYQFFIGIQWKANSNVPDGHAPFLLFKQNQNWKENWYNSMCTFEVLMEFELHTWSLSFGLMWLLLSGKYISFKMNL